MALAYILSGVTTGGLAAMLWLTTGGSPLAALGIYAITGQVTTLGLLAVSLPRRRAEA
ncbi:hypothetical protein [Sulfitobacter delicatus]|uniref:Uncharacterized protein n=1 Tax=Sulfitobacter delicatus TaxID=218672 RepID=A0A1G7PRB8_9RHOB|nr:hypothetical protein [Sulfitobacter delicatus]SDF88753.1 hypothetical protein SAMN04489759_103418 [Sulfitobacter delicatus]